MRISENGKIFIKNFEGLRLKAYKCPAGVWTIGYGHTGSDVKENMIITKEQAENLFNLDILVHSNNVSKLVRVNLTQNQFDALVSFEYNVGYGNFLKSTLLKKLNAKDYTGASQEFEKWVYSNKKRIDGLVKRRQKEKELFLR